MPNREDEQLKYWKECSNYIYNDIVSEINNVKKNKIQIIDWVWYYPKWVWISFIYTHLSYDHTLLINNSYEWYIGVVDKTPIYYWECEYKQSDKYKIWFIYETWYWPYEIWTNKDYLWDNNIDPPIIY